LNLISHDIYTLLLANGFTDLADGEIETNQDKVIAVLASEMPPSDLKDTYYEDGIQIFVRGNPSGGQKETWDSIVAVHNFLLALPDDFTVNGCEYKGFEMASSISTLGRDTNERFTASCNYSTFRAPLGS
jgi:sarcosine oxidase delta subunit